MAALYQGGAAHLPERHRPSSFVVHCLRKACLAGFVLAGIFGCPKAHASASGAPFSFGEVLVPSEGVRSLVAADLDGDGTRVLIGEEPAVGRIVIWVADGAGGLRVRTTFECASADHIVVGDFNDDGVKDIAVAGVAQNCSPARLAAVA